MKNKTYVFIMDDGSEQAFRAPSLAAAQLLCPKYKSWTVRPTAKQIAKTKNMLRCL